MSDKEIHVHVRKDQHVVVHHDRDNDPDPTPNRSNEESGCCTILFFTPIIIFLLWLFRSMLPPALVNNLTYILDKLVDLMWR